MPDSELNDRQLLRYSRQIMLPQVDVAGQQKLLDSTVLIVGLGGLGSPLAMYLAAAGIGHLILADFDEVEQSNLQRQIVHTEKSIGLNKAESAKQTLININSEIKITTLTKKLSNSELEQWVTKVDCVADATDNFATRFAINTACVNTQTPLVSGAAIRFEGQVSVFLNTPGSPCYQCLYPDTGEELDQSCSENGVLSPLVGLIGSIQATETLKLLMNIGNVLQSRLLILDASTMEWRTLKFKQDPGCPICHHNV